MYKPAKIRQFVTPAVHKKAVEVEINGRITKQLEEVGNLRGQFKQKRTAVITANGLLVNKDEISYITWLKNDIVASDVLTIKGVDYKIIGTPENAEMRGRYSILNLEKISGGA